MSFRERVLLGIIASGLVLGLSASSCDPKPVVPDRGIVYEDEVGWKCWEMGNKLCGPQVGNSAP